MKRRLKAAYLLLIVFTFIGCSNSKEEDLRIFPSKTETWVGDPMPYYDGEKFNIFYLEDLRDGDIGFHPWSLFTTNNFYEYKDEGIVIPYSKNTQDQDLALGTGSVIKDNDGLYHAFYTGHNSKKMPKEAIMHATSTDLNEWTKIPEDTFWASSQYVPEDFRDPYVIYNEDYKEYWMLITTRKDKVGVITLYTSSDLKKWTDKGVLLSNDMGSDSNMECPTLIKYGDYWYISFSEQEPNRVVHYRMANDSKGPFTIPKQDYFDGNGFYAGRMEQDSENLYMFGWTPTKEMYTDSEAYDWAGNLVVHQLKQKENGELYPVPVEDVVNKINKETKLKPLTQTETIEKAKNKYIFSGQDYEVVTFPELQGVNKITGKINLNSQNSKFGFMFNVDEESLGSVNIVIDDKKNEIQFYNTSTEEILTAKPQSTMPLAVNEGESLEFTLLIDDSVGVLYLNNEAVLSTRMFSMQDQKWGIFSIDSNIEFEDLKLSR